jgi:hypothetical protein
MSAKNFEIFKAAKKDLYFYGWFCTMSVGYDLTLMLKINNNKQEETRLWQ